MNMKIAYDKVLSNKPAQVLSPSPLYSVDLKTRAAEIRKKMAAEKAMIGAAVAPEGATPQVETPAVTSPVHAGAMSDKTQGTPLSHQAPSTTHEPQHAVPTGWSQRDPYAFVTPDQERPLGMEPKVSIKKKTHKDSVLSRNLRYLFHEDPDTCLRRICQVALRSMAVPDATSPRAESLFKAMRFAELYPDDQRDWKAEFDKTFQVQKVLFETPTAGERRGTHNGCYIYPTTYDFVLRKQIEERVRLPHGTAITHDGVYVILAAMVNGLMKSYKSSGIKRATYSKRYFLRADGHGVDVAYKTATGHDLTEPELYEIMKLLTEAHFVAAPDAYQFTPVRWKVALKKLPGTLVIRPVEAGNYELVPIDGTKLS